MTIVAKAQCVFMNLNVYLNMYVYVFPLTVRVSRTAAGGQFVISIATLPWWQVD